MKTFLSGRRDSGILAHITSLPSPFGIGDIGPSSHRFLDFLYECGQTYWQMLPVGPTNPIFDNSPYMSTSAFAGSPLLLSPERLFERGLINRQNLERHSRFSPYQTEFTAVIPFKNALLQEAFDNFQPDKEDQYAAFLDRTPWLDDYALFMTLKEKFAHAGWNQWPDMYSARHPDALAEVRDRHAERMAYYRFEQFEFFRQWDALRTSAGERGIRLIGDLPIYVGFDSVDVWAHQDLFVIDPTSHCPTRVAGVPPDYFSATGQRWGNPLYNWHAEDRSLRERLMAWWTERFAAIFGLFDVVRIDHFRGFESYWSIPADEETAVNGEWLQGPGKPFFTEIFSRLGRLDIIAEDLGEITPAVIRLKNSLGFPGMKILQFAFDENTRNSFLPYNFESANCVVYTGTHDNDTTVGWYLSDKLDDAVRKRIKEFANRNSPENRDIHLDFIYLALSSTAGLAILPLQDVLGFGNDCRMNIPGTKAGNWRWRCAPEFLTAEAAAELKRTTRLFGRGSAPADEAPAECPR